MKFHFFVVLILVGFTLALVQEGEKKISKESIEKLKELVRKNPQLNKQRKFRFGDAVLNVTQLIQLEGYPVENHVVQTKDGFLLNIQRIPYGINNDQKRANRPVAFLQHGLLDSAATWVVNTATESLGFLLADAGFDVWLGNARGNTYSNQNTMYSGSDLWNLVDYDNMIAIDLPTMINYVLGVTGQKSLVYVGHSQGTVMGFGAFPIQTDLAAKIDIFIALAPVAYVQNQESLFLTFLAKLDLAEWLVFFGEQQFLPNDWVLQFFAATFCKFDPSLCYDVVYILCGYNQNNLNLTREQIYFDVTPAGTSVRNMLHWSQGVSSGDFKMFDYGSASANQQHYGQSTPPSYRPQDLHHPPVAFFTGTNDDLADPADVLKLLDVLPQDNKPVVIHNEPSYEHLDFTWGLDAHIKIYPQVIQLAQTYSAKRRSV